MHRLGAESTATVKDDLGETFSDNEGEGLKCGCVLMSRLGFSP